VVLRNYLFLFPFSQYFSRTIVISAILTWNVYTFKNTRWQYVFRIGGIAGLAILAFICRSGEDGTDTMHPHWWGILGLIGWAYLFTCIFYQLLKGNIILLAGAVALCTFLYILFKQPVIPSSEYLSWLSTQSGHAAHTSIALCGVVLSRIFFNSTKTSSNKLRFTQAAFFAVLLFTAGYLLRPYYKISKIYATPSWCLYSAAACCIIFALLYWTIDINGKSSWMRFFKPAATNPLLTYIIPGILFSFFSLTAISIFPQQFRFGIPGILWSFLFAVAVMCMAWGLNKLKIRMQL
jgi:heparan-alpha-glucosaminide N-acetyltransferase